MKKVIPFMLFVILSIVFTNNNVYAQSNSDWGKQIKLQLHKLLNLDGDGQYDCDEALKVRQRDRLKDGSGACTGFIDEDGDGVCDNCGGTGDCDRDRLNDGKGLKKRGGN